MGKRGRKFTRALHDVRPAVDFARGLDQQVRQRRVQRVARHQLGGRRDHMDRRGRQVLAEIERAHWQFELRQVRKAARVCVGLREIVELHIWRTVKLAHDRGLRGIAGEESGVDLPGDEGLRRVFARKRQQFGRAARLDAVGLQKRERQFPGAAAFGADCEPLALEFGESRDRWPVIEDRQRHIRHAAERHQAIACCAGRDAVLHEAHVDVRVRV